MDTDDLEPTVEKEKIKDLDIMSIEALSDYVRELEREIRRVQKAISAKKEARSSAENFFNSWLGVYLLEAWLIVMFLVRVVLSFINFEAFKL